MDLSQILNSFVAQGTDTKDKLIGATVIVVDRNGIVSQGSAGRVDLPLDSAEYTTETFTGVASLTKLITSIALLQLVDKGALTLDEDLRTRVPRLANLRVLKGFHAEKAILEDNHRPITLRHLLTHTSGLPYDFVDSNIQEWARITGRTSGSLDCTIEGITTPLIFQPGDSWMYGTGIDWAGHVLENLTGMPLSKYLEENLFKPLGMRHSTFQPDSIAGAAKSKAVVLHRAQDGTLVHGPWPLSIQGREIDNGGGGLFTTAADYAKVIQAIVMEQVPGLGEKTLELLFVPQLNEEQKAACMRVAEFAHDRMCPEYPPGAPINHTLVGMINEEDVPGKRKSGSVMWSGMANGHWWVDAKSGLGGVFLTTLMPLGDPAVIGLFDEIEREVYTKFKG